MLFDGPTLSSPLNDVNIRTDSKEGFGIGNSGFKWSAALEQELPLLDCLD
jgi:hypothetical protein